MEVDEKYNHNGADKATNLLMECLSKLIKGKGADIKCYSISIQEMDSLFNTSYSTK